MGVLCQVDDGTLPRARVRRDHRLAADRKHGAHRRFGELCADQELGPDNVYAWAKEQAGEVSHEMFGGWMYRNKLSLSGAAEALGISRRMVSYYRTAHKAIPRSLSLI